MKTSRMAASGCLVAALAVGIAACGSDSSSSSGGSSSGSGGESKTLDVYSSLPLQGASRAQTEALVNGTKLALEQTGGKAGNFTVKSHSLDDSTAQAGKWTPEATQANARKAAQDENAAVYIGEFNSGASAVSIPILNEAGRPADLARPTRPSASPPTSRAPPRASRTSTTRRGKRTYARIVPKDTIQGAALATLMKQDGCTKVAMANDKEVYGAGLAKNIELAAKAQGLNIISNEAIDKNAANYRSLASKAKGAGPTASCSRASPPTARSRSTRTSRRRCRTRSSTARTASPSPASPTRRRAASPPASARRVKVTVATLDPGLSTRRRASSSSRSSRRSTARRTRTRTRSTATRRCSSRSTRSSARRPARKEDILKALFATKDRTSVLGTYSIDENGDTTLTDYGVYTVDDGELKFDETIKAQPAG